MPASTLLTEGRAGFSLFTGRPRTVNRMPEDRPTWWENALDGVLVTIVIVVVVLAVKALVW